MNVLPKSSENYIKEKERFENIKEAYLKAKDVYLLLKELYFDGHMNPYEKGKKIIEDSLIEKSDAVYSGLLQITLKK